MPRVFTSANDPLDFCADCFPKTEQSAWDEYADMGEGPDGRGNCFAYDSDHPAYDCEDYKCCKCGKQLDVEDEMHADGLGERFGPTAAQCNDILGKPGHYR